MYGARVMRCGCGRMISTTAGQTLTTSRHPDAQARLLRTRAYVVQMSVADTTETWSWLTWPRKLYSSPGTQRNIVRDQVDYGEVCLRCVCKHLISDGKACLGFSVLQLTLYASLRELFVLCTFPGIKNGLITRNQNSIHDLEAAIVSLQQVNSKQYLQYGKRS
jgi:hypothetical protein